MKKLAPGLLLLTSIFASSGGQEQRLYDGHSLAGWQAAGEARWTSVAGVIEASDGGDGFLVSEDRYGEYLLTLEFWVDTGANSGVFIGCQDRVNLHPDHCYEINIWDEHPQQQARTGAIVNRVMPPLAHVNTAGRWNRLEIRCAGGEIRVTVNGVLTAVLEGARTGPGLIALQHFNSGTVRFRDLLLRPASQR
jgi:hypothetical protein